MEAAAVMKVEAAGEGCALCGAAEELRSLEEHDQELGAADGAPPLRAQLLHLAHNKTLPEGPVCGPCARRGAEAYQFSSGLSRGAPLSARIRALRRRLHDLTQKIDVIIVVGGAQEGGSYNEQDIIMVDRAALAAAAAADHEELERAHNARGDCVYQCSVCPSSFQRLSEFREHCAVHPASARHSCWTCGAQFASRAELAAHDHRGPRAPHTCHLCHTTYQSQSALRQHSSVCPSTACPGCGAALADRAALAAHAAARHGPAAAPPCVCPVCFAQFPEGALLSAHALRHRLARAFVCGHAGCVLRFAARAALLAHVRQSHGPQAAPGPARLACEHCPRTFGSAAAARRHARAHGAGAGEGQGQGAGGEEYLDMEALEDDGEPDL